MHRASYVHYRGRARSYVIVYWGEHIVGKTHVLYNNVNPVWNLTVEVACGAPHESRRT